MASNAIYTTPEEIKRYFTVRRKWGEEDFGGEETDDNDHFLLEHEPTDSEEDEEDHPVHSKLVTKKCKTIIL